MAALTELQATVTDVTARNGILALIGNIFALQAQTSAGKVTKTEFNFFITNIKSGLKQVRNIINGVKTTETEEEKTTRDVQSVLVMIQTFQKTLTSGNVANMLKVLQQILSTLTTLSKQTKDKSIVETVTTIVKTFTTVETQVKSAKFDVKLLQDMISKIQTSLKEVVTTSTANTKISKLEILIKNFQKTVSGGNTKIIGDILQKVFNQHINSKFRAFDFKMI